MKTIVFSNSKLFRLTLPILLAILIIAVFAAISGNQSNATAKENTNLVFVDAATCPNNGTGSQGDPFCSIQTAVNAVGDGGEVRVAGGTYAGTQTITATNGYTYTQVVFIEGKSITLRGGYNPADWNADPNHLLYTTTLDAQRSGRGITVIGSGSETVTVDGFIITNGDYTNLGNRQGVYGTVCEGTSTDCGGGLYAYWAEIHLKNSKVFDNIATTLVDNRNSLGGGIYFWNTTGTCTIENTQIISNTSIGINGYGGGWIVYFGQGQAITNTVFIDNHSKLDGGGVYIHQPSQPIRILQSYFADNSCTYEGGGLRINPDYEGEALTMNRVRFFRNHSTDEGSALSILKQGPNPTSVTLENMIFDGNYGTYNNVGASVLSLSSWATMTVSINHATAANNPAYKFLQVESDDDPGDLTFVELKNTLIKSSYHAFTGLQKGSGVVEIKHTNTLMEDVTNMNYAQGGTPIFTAINVMTGTAGLDPSNHLLPTSDAIDAGVDAGVTHDYDGDPRDDGKPDIGADELRFRIYAPMIIRD
jgi:hypothetical protein